MWSAISSFLFGEPQSVADLMPFVPPSNNMLKCITLGQLNCGKTTTFHMYQNGTDRYSYPIVISDFHMKEVVIDNTSLRIQLWDTQSMERFCKLPKSHYRNAHLVIIMYDITRHESFSNVEEEVRDLRRYCDQSEVVVALIGNKLDMEQKRMVTTKQGLELAVRHNIPLFFEISSRTDLESVYYSINASLKATWRRHTMKYSFQELNDYYSQFKWVDPFLLFKQTLVQQCNIRLSDVDIHFS